MAVLIHWRGTCSSKRDVDSEAAITNFVSSFSEGSIQTSDTLVYGYISMII